MLPPNLPPAIILKASQEPDLSALKLSEARKAFVEALKKSGYTLKRVETKKDNFGIAATLELASSKGPQVRVTFASFEPGDVVMARDVELDETIEKAQTRAAELAKTNSPIKFTASPRTDKKDTSWLAIKLSLPENALSPEQFVGMVGLVRDVKTGATAEKAPPVAPAEPSDPLGKMIQESKLVYKDTGSFYQVKFSFTDTKRNQLVHVRKAVWSYNSLQVQEIYSTLYQSESAPRAELVQSMFLKLFGIGGLILEAPSENQKFWRIRFKIDAPTTSTPERLKSYMVVVAATADALEKEFSGEDKQ